MGRDSKGRFTTDYTDEIKFVVMGLLYTAAIIALTVFTIGGSVC